MSIALMTLAEWTTRSGRSAQKSFSVRTANETWPVRLSAQARGDRDVPRAARRPGARFVDVRAPVLGRVGQGGSRRRERGEDEDGRRGAAHGARIYPPRRGRVAIRAGAHAEGARDARGPGRAGQLRRGGDDLRRGREL